MRIVCEKETHKLLYNIKMVELCLCVELLEAFCSVFSFLINSDL